MSALILIVRAGWTRQSKVAAIWPCPDRMRRPGRPRPGALTKAEQDSKVGRSGRTGVDARAYTGATQASRPRCSHPLQFVHCALVHHVTRVQGGSRFKEHDPAFLI